MLRQETQNRFLTTQPGNLSLPMAVGFGKNILFYLLVLLEYFAPWCLFLLPWILLAVKIGKTQDNKAATLAGRQWMLIWPGVVFFFFSLVHVRLSHYVLVLSTPFAILVGFYLTQPFPKSSFSYRWILGTTLFILLAGFMAIIFLKVLWLKETKALVFIYLFALGILIWGVVRTRVLPVSFWLGFFMVYLLSHAPYATKAGITSHATLKALADFIKGDSSQFLPQKDFLIAIGSHDIHEKELQVYFEDKQILKAGHEYEPLARMNLKELLYNPLPFYCVITANDYNHFEALFKKFQVIVLKEDFIVRKRFYFDRGFILAILKLDQSKIYDYLMEKIILLRTKAGDV
jgi:hypothetical protein